MVKLRSGKIVDVTKRLRDGCFSGHPLKLDSVKSSTDHLLLPWKKVGVYKFAGVDIKKKIVLSKDDVECKLMMCGDYLYEWLQGWTMSKKDQ